MVSGIDVSVMLVYLAVLAIIGFASVRSVKNHHDFLVAGGRLGYGLYVPAMAAVVLGGASTLGGSGLGYTYGISGMWLVLMIGLGITGMGVLFAKPLSRVRVYSVSELLGNRFGPGSRMISAVIMAVYDLMVCVTGVIAMGIVLSTLFGLSDTTAIVLGGFVVLMYTIVGGMWAVTLTDVIQFWVMTLGLIGLLLPIGLYHVGGFGGLLQQVDPAHVQLLNLGESRIFAYFLLYFFGMMIGQDIWQRAFTAKSETVLRRGTIYAGLYCIVYAVAGALIGMTASVLIPGLADPQQAIPQMALQYLPVGLFGLVMAAIASAVMSTASGTIMASATVIVNDLFLPYAKKEYSDRAKLNLTRLVLLIAGACAIMIAAWLKDIVVALDVAYALLTGSVFIPILAAFFWKRVTARVTLWSMAVSAVVVIADLSIEGLASLNAIMFGIAACGITMLVGTWITSRRSVDDNASI
ncbi:sodium:solute symporter family transporter [Brevibacillus sp. TJ4]|uniref:sodium:solute symporter family transporter n=1 Tax=Brevibacillus sp. TJ4 TaxID=3234853 RepID=UPI0037D701B9